MQLSLRLKVSLLWLPVIVVVAWLLGFVLYLTCRQLFTQQFLPGKLAVAKAVDDYNGATNRLTARSPTARAAMALQICGRSPGSKIIGFEQFAENEWSIFN